MRITDWMDKEQVAKKYPIFKGYPIKLNEKGEKLEEDHFVVPWAMEHDECKDKKN